MDNYEKLINECEKLGAKVYEFDFGTSKPAGMCEGNEIYINKSCTTNEKYCVLLEELGHFLTTYGDITNQNDLKNRKQELFARRWGYEKVTLERIIEAIGQFTTQQKRQTRPIAAPSLGSRPKRGAATQPKVAPTKKVGTISPPLKPKPIVTAVKRSLSKKAKGSALPSRIALSAIFIPAPL